MSTHTGRLHQKRTCVIEAVSGRQTSLTGLSFYVFRSSRADSSETALGLPQIAEDAGVLSDCGRLRPAMVLHLCWRTISRGVRHNCTPHLIDAGVFARRKHTAGDTTSDRGNRADLVAQQLRSQELCLIWLGQRQQHLFVRSKAKGQGRQNSQGGSQPSGEGSTNKITYILAEAKTA